MTDSIPSDAATAFDGHDAYERTERGYTITTTVFDGILTASEADVEWALTYTLAVEVPTLSMAVEGTVGPAVAEGWLDTFERRLEDAPKATRASVDLDDFRVIPAGESVSVEYTFTLGTPAQAADIAKTFAEYVEGTYAEGIVPGYDYRGPAAQLIDNAQSGGADGERGGTPL